MFDSRATATEFLDRPDCVPVLAAAGYRFMETAMYNSRTRPDGLIGQACPGNIGLLWSTANH